MGRTCANCGDSVREDISPVMSMETGDIYCSLTCKLQHSTKEKDHD